MKDSTVQTEPPRNARAPRWFFLLARAFLGAVLLVSGIAKIFFPDDAANLLGDLLSEAILDPFLVAYTLAIFECGAGLLLIAGRFTVVLSIVVGVFLLVAIGYGVLTMSSPQPCGCFGALVESKTDEVFIARNMILLFIALYVLKESTTMTQRTAP
jgi:uncharacterized membrane protein YphA (DoxX/SURF4 family)